MNTGIQINESILHKWKLLKEEFGHLPAVLRFDWGSVSLQLSGWNVSFLSVIIVGQWGFLGEKRYFANFLFVLPAAWAFLWRQFTRCRSLITIQLTPTAIPGSSDIPTRQQKIFWFYIIFLIGMCECEISELLLLGGIAQSITTCSTARTHPSRCGIRGGGGLWVTGTY